MQTVKTLAKGQVVIPADIRAKFGIVAGSMLLLEVTDTGIALRPLPKDPIAAFGGSLPSARSTGRGQPTLADQLRRERQLEAEHEAKRWVPRDMQPLGVPSLKRGTVRARSR